MGSSVLAIINRLWPEPARLTRDSEHLRNRSNGQNRMVRRNPNCVDSKIGRKIHAKMTVSFPTGDSCLSAFDQLIDGTGNIRSIEVVRALK